MSDTHLPIPVNTPLLDGNERKYLLECLDTGWISSEGPFVRRFEEKFAEKVRRKFGIAVSNGSAALDAAIVALGIDAGDEVILPSFTIISCAAAIIRAGAIPVVVDSDPNTWNMTAEGVEKAITRRTKAIMVVHIYGLPVDMDPILALAENHGLRIIEDAAEMHGQTYKGRPCGSFGDISVFSFYPNKHITTGEGGMIMTDDPTLAEKCRSIRNLCFQANRRFVHEELGWNFRMTNLQAALGVAQLETLDAHVVRKREIGSRYHTLLGKLRDVQLPLIGTEYAQNIYWVFGLVLGDSHAFGGDEAMRRLAAHKIGTRPFFWPMHLQPVFKKMGLFANARCPVAERIARNGFYIPSGIGLKDGEVERVAEKVYEVINSK
jgi:perosamine synthetase